MKDLFEWFTPAHRWQVKLGFFSVVLLIGIVFILSLTYRSGIITLLGLGTWCIFWIKISYKYLKNKPSEI